MDPLTSLKSPAREHGGGEPRAAAAELLGVWLAAGMAREHSEGCVSCCRAKVSQPRVGEGQGNGAEDSI